jgi:hypothetical protein
MKNTMYYSLKELNSDRNARYLKSSHVKRKELYETTITLDKSIKIIKKHYSIDRLHTIYDFCSGHTFNGLYAVSREYAKFAVVFDKRFPRSSYHLAPYYTKRHRVEYREEDIHKTDYSNLNENSLVLSIHPCRGLAYKVTDIAIQNRLPIVIVPCCECNSPHSSSLNDINIIDRYTKHCLNIIIHLEKNDYKVRTKTIKSHITPKNNIIIGLPN